jgi:16S rRNA (guanine527-N7)-methyltransferase
MEEKYRIYIEELLNWNKKFNLTAITDPEEIRVKHFEDSLSLLNTIHLTTQSVIDIGTGAGFPGIPLKIECPGIKLTLVEATKKKVEFLKHLVKTLGLEDVEIIWGRAEKIARERREQFDIAVSRAVAELNTLAEWCLPFVKVGGLFVAYKTENTEKEIEGAQQALSILGGRIKEIRRLQIGIIKRSLVIIEKTSSTPEKYPRRPGMAKKRPL